MSKGVAFTILLQLWMSGAFCKRLKVYTADDIFITNNTTSSYSNIPEDCKLFGADFDEGDSINNVTLNMIKRPETFWIGAKVQFIRQINPIGHRDEMECGQNKDNLSLDECNTMCKNNEYFNLGKKTCNCENGANITKSNLLKAEKCPDKGKILCTGQECIVYQRVNNEESYTCDTYKYSGVAQYWILEQKKCSEKGNFGSICTRGVLMKSDRNLSWFEAFQSCKDLGSDLLHNTTKIPKTDDSGITYWVSFFRRTRIVWGTATNRILCVAAEVNLNGVFEPVTRLCTDNLPALCHSKQPTNGGIALSQLAFIVSGSCGGAVLLLAAFSLARITLRE